MTRVGDLWVLGEHRLLCGDALQAESYARVLGTDKAEMMFADPPYNVPIEGHVSGLGAVKHADFAMASGELSSAEFQSFLRTSLGHAASRSIDGAIHFVCMDWRHQREIIAAGDRVYSELKNLCVWNKSNAGMGSLYRSKHELIFVFKVGKGAHINNVALGRYGRHRTNVWDYVSQNALNGTAKSKLALHPTVKPVAMIADAIRDCSNRGGLILDPFGGAGTTLIAAERTGRRARVIELDPIFVDVSIERWQRLTGGTARPRRERSAVRAVRATTRRPISKGEDRCPGVRPRRQTAATAITATRSATQAPEAQPVPTGPVGQSGRAPQRRAQSQDRREAHAGDAGQGEGGRPHADEINAGRCPHGAAREGAPRRCARARSLPRAGAALQQRCGRGRTGPGAGRR